MNLVRSPLTSTALILDSEDHEFAYPNYPDTPLRTHWSGKSSKGKWLFMFGDCPVDPGDRARDETSRYSYSWFEATHEKDERSYRSIDSVRTHQVTLTLLFLASMGSEIKKAEFASYDHDDFTRFILIQINKKAGS